MKTMRRRGFTLIELMITLAIFAFLIMIAGPQYADFMGNSQIRNGAENVLTGVRLAQAEAVRGNTQAQFVLDPATGWQVSRLDDETATFVLVQSYKFADGAAKTSVTTLPGDATEVTFNGLGRAMDPNPDATAPIKRVDVTNTNVSAANRRPLRIVITSFATSSVKLCDQAVTDTSDPRFCPTS
jgi:type IV fimbrial biogenesis protein FimT